MVEEKETPEESCPKHVIDERKVEEAIERMYRSEQQDMFDDPDMNWSGLRWVILAGQILNSTLSGLVVEQQKKKMNNFVACFHLTVHHTFVIVK